MRSLAVGNAAALIDVELIGGARPEHPVGVGPNVQRAEPAKLAGANDLAHRANMRAKTLGMTAQEFDLVLDRRFDHALGFL